MIGFFKAKFSSSHGAECSLLKSPQLHKPLVSTMLNTCHFSLINPDIALSPYLQSTSLFYVARRFRFKRCNYPPQFTKYLLQKLKTAEPIPKVFTFRQYLSWLHGKWHPGPHAEIKKNFRKKAHPMFPYYKIPMDAVQEITEYSEYLISQGGAQQNTQNSVNSAQIMRELDLIESRQKTRQISMLENISKEERERQQTRKDRINAKREKLQETESSSEIQYDDDNRVDLSKEFVFD